ncbi:hypothetical protein SK128_006757 [Halocaridina rubra]|uniref:Uncharacterized protein n=1 Tax=Halocaridina rubra TaxID=373956 RepID=A0AAN9AD07_HALRR
MPPELLKLSQYCHSQNNSWKTVTRIPLLVTLQKLNEDIDSGRTQLFPLLTTDTGGGHRTRIVPFYLGLYYRPQRELGVTLCHVHFCFVFSMLPRWAFIRKQIYTRENMGHLQQDDGTLTTRDLEKAETFNKYVVAVYTEDTTLMPVITNIQYDRALDTFDLSVM